MQVAINSNRDRKIAWNTEKSEGPFYCPHCDSAVTLKKGPIKEHHFAHKPPYTCPYAAGESQKHFKAKREIYQALSRCGGCTKLEIERVLKGVRPDISLFIGQYPVAIEIQKSTIDINAIIERTTRYSDLGVYLLWLLPDPKPSNLKFIEDQKRHVCRPREWHKFLHAMYYGRLYYWKKDTLVSPVHLSRYEYYVKPGNWVDDFYETIGDSLEGTVWHDENYYQAGYGDYMKTHKTLKCLQWPKENSECCIDLVTSFKPAVRDTFRSSNWTIPSAKLWRDNLPNWWND